MKLHSALLLVAGLMIGCQQPGLSADSPDAKVMDFLSIVVREQTSVITPFFQYISIDAKNGEIVEDYRTTEKFPPCEEVGRLICIWGHQLHIMIPEDWAKVEEGWSFQGVRFRVLSKFYLHRELDTLLVEARDRDVRRDPTYYMYSLKRGLVGFRLYYSGGPDPKAPPIPVDYARLW